MQNKLILVDFLNFVFIFLSSGANKQEIYHVDRNK
jgi:hypothetical protein